MKTYINKLDFDWTNVKNKCRTTVNKEYTDKKATTDFKKKLLIAEHSPIRLLNIDWSWKNIKSWISVHWVRHTFQPFVSTRREDRYDLGAEGYSSRDELPQGVGVNFDGYANVQNAIDFERKRLCYKASPETREYAEDFKVTLFIHGEEEVAGALVPNCIYRGGCPEIHEKNKECKFYESFLKRHPELSLSSSIQERYDAYNEEFYRKHEVA